MGVLTTTYMVSQDVLDKFLKNSDNLDVIIYPDKKTPKSLGLEKDWKPQKFSFDKAWEDILNVLRGTGFSRLARTMEYKVRQIKYKYSDFYIRYWNSGIVKEISNSLNETSEENLKKTCLEKGDVQTYDGDIFDESYLSYVLGGFNEFISFMKQAAEKNQIILIISS